MSNILDKGRLKLIYEPENKSKTNYILSKKIIKNSNQLKQQPHLLKTYIGLSPNNNTNKKKPFLKSYNNSTLNHGHNTKYTQKKNISKNNLK